MKLPHHQVKKADRSQTVKRARRALGVLLWAATIWPAHTASAQPCTAAPRLLAQAVQCVLGQPCVLSLQIEGQSLGGVQGVLNSSRDLRCVDNTSEDSGSCTGLGLCVIGTDCAFGGASITALGSQASFKVICEELGAHTLSFTGVGFANLADLSQITPGCGVGATLTCVAAPGVCGNGTINTGEQCDGANLGGATCTSQGFGGGGTLACDGSCQYDTSDCTASLCGNATINTGEQCDGANLGGATCVSQGFSGGGTLACNTSCQFNTSGCTASLCGNATINTGEQCDGANLGGATCVSRGFAGGGTLACSTSCQFNTSGCTGSLCGNATINTGEQCDGANLGGATCVSRGFAGGGTLACNPSCQFNTVACLAATATCGDGVVNRREECDDGNTVDEDFCSNQCEITTCQLTPCPAGKQCNSTTGRCEVVACNDGPRLIGPMPGVDKCRIDSFCEIPIVVEGSAEGVAAATATVAPEAGITCGTSCSQGGTGQSSNCTLGADCTFQVTAVGPPIGDEEVKEIVRLAVSCSQAGTFGINFSNVQLGTLAGQPIAGGCASPGEVLCGECLTNVDCNDGNACTTDSCTATLECESVANNASCDDGNACTTNDACSDGQCEGGPQLVCNDGNVCTTDDCNAATGCTTTPNAAACNDRNACTTNDTCSDGQCLGGAPLDCNDGKVCTMDSCNPASGCTTTPNAAACNDGNACTTNDTCSGGSCVGGPALNCADSNVCTDDSCNTATGCVHPNNTASCNDGDACTTNDTCSGGSCVSGAALKCTDNNVCTNDSCDSASGCVHTDNAATCDDGNACTTTDVCSSGTCVGTGGPSCDDGKVCTTDTCSPGTGCVHNDNTANCDDGNACTTNDTCGGGSCVGGAALSCTDGNVCTNDSCDPASGCVHPNNTASCDDGDACTTSDACSGGTCVGGPALSCADGNGCTDDSCDPAKGCTHTNKTSSCDDGNPCTLNDICTQGICVGNLRQCPVGEVCSAATGQCGGGDVSTGQLVCISAADEPTAVFFGNMRAGADFTGGADADPDRDSLGPRLVFPNTAVQAYEGGSGDKIKYTVELPLTGDWYAWGRFYYPGSGMNDANSFFFQLDGGREQVFGNNRDLFQAFHWDGDGILEYGPPTGLLLGELSAGPHMIVISKREVHPVPSQPRLDAICLRRNDATPPQDGQAQASIGIKDCAVDADCDDGNACTTNACLDGVCVEEPVECIDSICDPIAGCPGPTLVCVGAAADSTAAFRKKMTKGGEFAAGADSDLERDSLNADLVFADSATNAFMGGSGDEVAYTVSLPMTGRWYLWGRFYYPGSQLNDANSFFAQIDGGDLRILGNNKDFFQAWHWGGDGRLPEGEHGVPTALDLGILPAGQHEILVKKREVRPEGKQPRLDVFCVRKDDQRPPADEEACDAGGCTP